MGMLATVLPMRCCHGVLVCERQLLKFELGLALEITC